MEMAFVELILQWWVIFFLDKHNPVAPNSQMSQMDAPFVLEFLEKYA